MASERAVAGAAVAVGLLLWSAVALYLVRRAECRAAGWLAPPPVRSVVLAAGIVALAVALRPAPCGAAACGVACTSLVLAAGADARTGFLFDAITLPAAALAAGFAIAAGDVADASAGVALLVGGFGAIVVLSRGRYMGLGDVKAMYALGAAFGPLESLVAIFAACLCGILTTAVRGRFRRGTEVRFGPHLAVGAVVALVAGDPVVHFLMGW